MLRLNIWVGHNFLDMPCSVEVATRRDKDFTLLS
jgi:hypothetical protein